mgnify:CR=1 FL=1
MDVVPALTHLLRPISPLLATISISDVADQLLPGISALATISAPTATGVQLAELAGVRLWGLCRSPRAVLYAAGA